MNKICIIWTVLFVLVKTEQLYRRTLLNNDNCTSLKTIFADSSSEFIKCSVNYSRPIKFCEKCVTPYINFLESYDNMSKLLVNNTPCIDQFVNLDRLGIIETIFYDNTNLWNRAKCNECFEIKNDKLTPNISKETKLFNDFYQKYNRCIHNVPEKNICKYCLNNYTQLYNYYSSISNENEKIGVCMDMVDLMNTTWAYWGDKCCKFRRHNEYVFILSMILVVIVTISFYILVPFYTEKRSPTIVEQSRFGKVLSSSSS
ncbi:hypothetical protein GWI33_004766 [Rhynchophorus ferrugineus]|uniref:Osteopetrosis-associated transmembrane protein 1 n=1 Tax=Rhynchophorus ferrugineus TaxID=354439 RepID=A0A834IP27_RHYFE|nr:hypothetical protein GWI33_004766 [Rhynchophorus ferrugineus]